MAFCSEASATVRWLRVDFGVDGALGHQAVEHGLLGFRRVEQLLVEVRAHQLAQAWSICAALRLLPLLLGDLRPSTVATPSSAPRMLL